ncbi:hypothetical protein OFO87_32950, partial [Escherichia coli]|nr:hypothetical protein [Escherichia coli]
WKTNVLAPKLLTANIIESIPLLRTAIKEDSAISRNLKFTVSTTLGITENAFINITKLDRFNRLASPSI